MENEKETFPIQVFTKVAAWISAIAAFVSLAYYSTEEEYITGVVAFVSGVLSFGVLMTIAKIADGIDELKKK